MIQNTVKILMLSVFPVSSLPVLYVVQEKGENLNEKKT